MFPERTKWLGRRIGWRDLGLIAVTAGGYCIHDFCKTVLRIGKEDDKLFKYCPRCMVKTKDPDKSTNT